MTRRRLGTAAVILILAALALIVFGLSRDAPLLWGLGLIATGAAMIMSLLTRWAGDEA